MARPRGLSPGPQPVSTSVPHLSPPQLTVRVLGSAARGLAPRGGLPPGAAG
jgi:hypothetical protein